jgi:hypothetical protein
MNCCCCCCISSITVAFHSIPSLLLTTTISFFISSIATEVLQVLQLIQQFHLHFLQPEKYDFHIYNKRILCEQKNWLYSSDFKKEFFFFARFLLHVWFQQVAKRLKEFFKFSTTFIIWLVYSQIWLNLVVE